MREPIELTSLERRLLDRYQRGFPLAARPFRAVAEVLDSDEAAVLLALRRLTQAQVLSRLGPVFRPHVFGASTLAAMAVPDARLDEVAALVSARPEVNHNYRREHRFNLWFVVAGADAGQVRSVLDALAASTGLPVLDLPLLTDYHIDLGFPLDGTAPVREIRAAARPRPLMLTPLERRVVAVVQGGLPLLPRPYAELARRAGCAETELVDRLERWLAGGQIRRLGLVVRHHELGFRANAMAVWDIADDTVDHVGEKLASFPFVTLCYRRPRRPPHWRYNLFCMIHGRDRATVEEQHRRLVDECGLARVPRALLFSTRRYKQQGARYCRPLDAAGEGR